MASDERADEDVRAMWQTQHAGDVADFNEIRARVEQMERKARRARHGFYVALTASSIAILGIAAVIAHATLITGAVLLLCGLGVLLYEMRDHRRHAPAATDGVVTTLEYQRRLLQHRLEFHRRRLLLRTVALAPGGLLFFLGFAVARPDLAPLIHFQLATFVLAVVLIVPANRRAMSKLERQLEQLDELRKPGSL